MPKHHKSSNEQAGEKFNEVQIIASNVSNEDMDR